MSIDNEDLQEIKEHIAKINSSLSKMDNHIDFIDSVYNRMRPMLNFLSFRFNTSKNSDNIRYNEYQMIDRENINEEDKLHPSDITPSNDITPSKDITPSNNESKIMLIPVMATISIITILSFFTLKKIKNTIRLY